MRDLLRGRTPTATPTSRSRATPSPSPAGWRRRIDGARLTVHSRVRHRGRRRARRTSRRRRRHPQRALPGARRRSRWSHRRGSTRTSRRRDFTVNALAAALAGPQFGELLDPFDGRARPRRRPDPRAASGVVPRRPHPPLPRGPLRRPARLCARARDRGAGTRRDRRRDGRPALGRSGCGPSWSRFSASRPPLSPPRSRPGRRPWAARGRRPGARGRARSRAAQRVARLDELAAAARHPGHPVAGAAGGDRRRRRRRRAIGAPRRSACGSTAARPRSCGAAATAPARLGPRLAAAATPADVAELLDRLPVEVALVVAADGGPGAARRRALPRAPARHPPRDRRHGAARRARASAQSPRVGEVLAELLRRKRNGQLADRGSELAAARELVGRAAS